MRTNGREGVATSRAPASARAGRGRLGKKIAQLRRTPSGTPLRLRNWSLRTKLVAVLLIPTLTALVLIGLHFNNQLRAANRLGELSARVTVDGALSNLVHSLQRERDLTVHFVASGRKMSEDQAFTDQRERVDGRLAAFSKAYSSAKPELSDGAAKDLDGAQSRLEGLTRLRFGAQHDKYPADKVLETYSNLVTSLLAARERTVSGISEPELVRLQLAAGAVSRIKERTSVTRALVDEALVTGKLDLDRRRELAAADGDASTWRKDFDTFATVEQERMYDDTVTGALVDARSETLQAVIARSENGQSLQGLDAAQWDNAATYTSNLMLRVEQALQAQLQTRTDALAAEARTSALRDGAIVLVLLLLAGMLAVVIGRSLIRPLRTLRSTALEVAEYRLPAAVHGLLANPKGPRKTDVAPVPVTSTEEVGQVARAFDAVHGEAVRLAAEQAELRQNVNVMFLNLARRGQELADRQLDVLDRMEADEQDPDVLAKLFELDHLATRSRRVSENLLVLTGNDFARMLPGSVAASEVIAAALSEIEHYQRVQLSTIPEIAVRGDAVSDVVHVISELLENATNESGADASVSVVSSINREGAWLVEITDTGEGMSVEEMDTANARLADPPEIDVEASRRMGLYVVARLARRNGLEVRLRQAHAGGITASVLVPARLIGELPDAGTPRTDTAAGRRPDWLETASKRQAARESRALQLPGPPKVAPIEKRDAAGLSHPLEEELPTERMPMYRDLLSKWFERSAPSEPMQHPAQRAAAAAAAADEPEPSEPMPAPQQPPPQPPQPPPAAAPPVRNDVEPPTRPEHPPVVLLPDPAATDAASPPAEDPAESGELPSEQARAASRHITEPLRREPQPELEPEPEPEPVAQEEPERPSEPQVPAFAQLAPLQPPETPRQRTSEPEQEEELDSRTVRMTRRQHAAKGVNSQLAEQQAVSGRPSRPVRGNLDLDRGSSPMLSPPRDGASAQVGSGGGGQQRPVSATSRTGPISRAPDAVRGRMVSLADGRRRARHARGAEYPDSGRSASVGTGRRQWPADRAGVGGDKKEG